MKATTKRRIAFYSVIFFIFLFNFGNFEAAAQSKFTEHRLKHGITVEIPSSWKIIPQNVMEQIDTVTEMTTKQQQGNNEIIFAANCYTYKKIASASIRISLRFTKTSTQSEVSQASDSSIDAQSKLQAISLVDTVRKLQPDFTVYSMTGKKAAIGSKVSLLQEYSSNSGADGVVLTKLHIVCLGDRMVKIMESYREEEASYFKPIFNYIESKLMIQ